MHSRPEFVPKLLPGEVQESPKRVPGGSPESPGTLPGGSRGSPGGVSSQVNEKEAMVSQTVAPFGHGNASEEALLEALAPKMAPQMVKS